MTKEVKPKEVKSSDLKYKKIVINAATTMAKRSLTVSTWGNISVRDPETGYIYLTPSGMDYKKTVPDDIVVFNAKGIRIKGTRKPSIEKDMHIKIYQTRKDINAVIHTHALYSTVLAVSGIPLPAITEEFAQTIGEVAPICEYAIPGTPLLADYVAAALGESHRAILLPSHGAICAADNMDMVLKQCDVLERAAHIYILSKSIGEPRIIPKDEVDHMFRFHNNQYGQ